ncbi:MAG: FecR domain-containing protein [Chitinophagaceae bacterium]|nr:FecR domain-containing protein [Chitinophagaceae bacterium]
MRIPDHIQELIHKYEQGRLSETEKKELDHWYHSFNDQEAVVSDMPEGNESDLSERIMARLNQSMMAEKALANESMALQKRKWNMSVAVALIFILLSGSLYYLMVADNSDTPKPLVTKTSVPANDVAPGGTKAMLTLDDGSIIVLDTASNGMLGQQGGAAVTKLDNGLVAYHAASKQMEKGDDKVFYNTISTPRGGEYQVTLSDGTKVWLNAASSIRFPTAFRGADRQVQITGEVYFEVAHNKTQPFRVAAGKSTIEELGTHFNVNAYEDEMQVRTSLLEGAVKVYPVDDLDHPQAKILKPGQQARMNKNSRRISVVNDFDTEEVIAWKNGLFVFKSEDLRSIMRQIARWYDVDVQYRGNGDLQFTGQITRNNNVSKVLEMLELTGEVKFKVQDKQVIVTR